MSKLTRAKTDLIFLKKYLENMKEHEWRYADYEIKAYERLLMYCETYIKIKELKNKMTKEQMQVSKEELEKIKMEQTKLELQSRPLHFGAKIPEEMEVPDDFINTLKEKLKDYNNRLIGYSQECEGTFKIKDGNVTDIHITGIALIPRFRDKDEGVE
jgi:hypothetical protein